MDGYYPKHKMLLDTYQQKPNPKKKKEPQISICKRNPSSPRYRHVYGNQIKIRNHNARLICLMPQAIDQHNTTSQLTVTASTRSRPV